MAKVLALYDADNSFRQIGEILGIARTTAYEDYRLAVKEMFRPQAEERIEKMERQYATLRRRWWQKAVEGDGKAADIILRAMQDERRLLGLDRPVKHEVSADAETAALAGQVVDSLRGMLGLEEDAEVTLEDAAGDGEDE